MTLLGKHNSVINQLIVFQNKTHKQKILTKYFITRLPLHFPQIKNNDALISIFSIRFLMLLIHSIFSIRFSMVLIQRMFLNLNLIKSFERLSSCIFIMFFSLAHSCKFANIVLSTMPTSFFLTLFTPYISHPLVNIQHGFLSHFF